MTFPSTEICLCRDVPLDSSYDHQVTFASQQAQAAYFYSKIYKRLQDNSYQRVMNNKLRIQCSIAEAMACNYLFFSNNAHDNKTIYAFITGWEYVNEVTTEITYEIDVFQTFWFDVRLLQVFVEREHDTTDTMWSNTVPENLELGEYVSNGEQALLPSNTGRTVIFYTNFNDDSTFSDFAGATEYVSGILTGLNIIYKTSETDANDFLRRVIAANKTDGVIAVFMCPFVPSVWGVTQETKTLTRVVSSLNGYIPSNNKLYTYPYCFLHIQTDVQGADFRYEFFNDSNNNCTFSLFEALIPQPTMVLVPTNYAGRTATNGGEFRLTLTDFPQCSWNADIFKVYLAQNAASLPTKLISQAATTAIGLGSMAVGVFPTGIYNGFEAVSAGAGIASTLAQLHDISTKPPQQNGTQTAMADYGIGYKNFMAERMSIRAEYARIIDDYFTLYGYATKRVKQPNITGRPYWNYVKTIGNTVDALGVPDPYLQTMNRAFNRGITFWHNPNNVGDYSLDNRPA